MRFCFIAFLFLVFSCGQEENPVKETTTVNTVQAEVQADSIKEPIQETAADDFNPPCTEGGIPALSDFLNTYISSQECREVIDALSRFAELETDTAMRNFYKRDLAIVSRSLNRAF